MVAHGLNLKSLPSFSITVASFAKLTCGNNVINIRVDDGIASGLLIQPHVTRSLLSLNACVSIHHSPHTASILRSAPTAINVPPAKTVLHILPGRLLSSPSLPLFISLYNQLTHLYIPKAAPSLVTIFAAFLALSGRNPKDSIPLAIALFTSHIDHPA